MAELQGTMRGPGFVQPRMVNAPTRAPELSDFAGPIGYSEGTILGPDGNPWNVTRDPLQPRSQAFATATYRDIPISLVELQWAVSDIRSALDDHAIGIFQSAAMLSDAIIGDDRVQAALGSRVGALFGLDQTFTAADVDASGEVLEAWKVAYKTATLSPLTGNSMQEVKRWAHLMGFGLAEVQWDTSGPIWQPYLKPWHPQFTYYDWPRKTLVAVTMDGNVDVTPGDGRWFVHAPHGIQRGWMLGAVRALALPWLLRSLGYRDWARYSERHGMPLVKAMMPAMARTEDKDRFVSSLATMGTEAVVSLPQNMDGTGFDVALIEAASQSWEGFDRLIQRCENSITLCLQWQNLTTEVKEGSFAAARVHADVKQSAVEFDEITLARDIHEQLARPFAAWNYGDPELAPSTRWDCEPLEDRDAANKALESYGRACQALTLAGVEYDPAELAKAYGVKGMRNAKLRPPPSGGASGAVGRVGGEPFGGEGR